MLNATEWWAIIRNYGDVLYPIQFIIMGLGIVLVAYFTLANEEKGSRYLKVYIGGTCLYIAGVFFLALGRDFPTPLKELQAFLFFSIGSLFLWDLKKNTIQFILPKTPWKKAVFWLMMVSILVYPGVGFITSRPPVEWIVPGAYPCPTTAFALVLMIFARPNKAHLLYGLLLIWAIPFAPFIQMPMYGVYEDGIMFVIGIIALVVKIMSLKKKTI